MTHVSHGSDLASSASSIPRKRKVRKGTQSCWECKRRKTRCIFATPADPTCVGCKSRDIKCVSQEVHEETPTPRTRATKPDRIASSAARSEQDNPGIAKSRRSPLVQDGFSTGLVPSLQSHRDICCALAGVWPPDRELDLISSVASKHSKTLRGPFYSPYSESARQGTTLLQDVLRPPPRESHPVLFARRLLLLAIVLPQCAARDGTLDGYKMASRMLHMVHTLVTSNDELIQSIEGVECIALESMYHNNRGNLRRALLSLRRAMVVAQLMGLHRHIHSSSLKVVDPGTRTRFDFDYIWLRLVESDRYLSLMLDVPQAWADDSFLDQKKLELCSPMERLERLFLVVGGRILGRNEAALQDLTVTLEIDRLLQHVSTCMSPQWWLVPNLSSSDDDVSARTDRFMLQFTHYFLLVQLHLPYLLCRPNNRFHAYCKDTAITASREILTRFVAFRGNETVTSYCRGVDFIVSIASTVVCLAHIVAPSGPDFLVEDTGGSDVLYNPSHQRFSDRGLVEKALEYMEKAIRECEDAIASKIAHLLRPLLDMEASSSIGAIFNAYWSSCEESECSDAVGGSGNILYISIPHCGRIRIECIVGHDALPLLDPQLSANMEDVDSMGFLMDIADNNVSTTSEAAIAVPEDLGPGLLSLLC